MKMRISLFLAASFAVIAGAAGQQFPTVERGFTPSKVYSFSDIDAINTFNGNLIVCPFNAKCP